MGLGDKGCPKCDGLGWLTFERDGFRGVTRCECAEAKIAARQKYSAGCTWPVPPALDGCKFSNFRVGKGVVQQSVIDARSAARHYVEIHKKQLRREGILFSGPPGIGKSHLAAAIVLALDLPAAWINSADFMARVRNSFNSDSSQSERDIAALQVVPLLVLDDLGAERLSEYSEEVFYRIIDARNENRRPIIVTTNRGFGQRTDRLADHIGERSFDRLAGMGWMQDHLNWHTMEGRSWRWDHP